MGDENSMIFILVMCIIFGGLLGWISFYIGAALMSWTGKWIDGKASSKSIFRMSAYASIPVVFSLILITLQILIFGNDNFKSDIYMESYSALEIVLFYLLALAELVIAIWTIAIYLIGLSEVQGFLGMESFSQCVHFCGSDTRSTSSYCRHISCIELIDLFCHAHNQFS
ncbi:Yip1 family protein [Ekhidna sp.]|uniref:Yip1 family protein n=1 Tax=Ekhidna sp. TaxID=2608089 RepID=UPI003C7DE1FF